MNKLSPAPGVPSPLGATVLPGGVNFAVFTRHAQTVSLVLFNHLDDTTPALTIDLNTDRHRTGDIRHVYIEGAAPGVAYLFRVDTYDALLDPYALAVSRDQKGKRKCVVVDKAYDWQGDRPLRTPMEKTIIYETHVKGFTVHPSSGVEHPGTYRGFIEKIPYLVDLGITAVELLPVHEYDDNEIIPKKPVNNGKLVNHWGYNTIGFFAPHGAYASSPVPGGQVTEFKDMVRELHKAGIEVILDVVFNHTAEGDADGPVYSFRGLDKDIYYLLDPATGAYIDYTGCRNTFNCGHPVVSDLVIDCLRYWATEMHVDGFRFDLAPVLCRDTEGKLMEKPPLVERISEDPVLRDTKLIAEAWDVGGAYQVGKFPGSRWAEWNDKYRDDMRRFWLKDPTLTGAFATRVSGSSDLYHTSGRKPFHSINFITSHDGFTLNDVVHYSKKHNDENGEGNKDGNDGEISDNQGIEGPSVHPLTERKRVRLIKSFAASLLLSRGTPMILGGDEIRRSQGGNNNAYCQDNETSWYNWYYLKEYVEVFDYYKKLIAFRKRNSAFAGREFYSSGGTWNITWFDENGGPVNWIKQNGFLAFMLTGTEESALRYYVLANTSKNDVPCSIHHPPEGTTWYRAVDTSVDPPRDVCPEGEEVPLPPYDSYVAKPHSVVVLITKNTDR